jgi:hypothetical protein
LAKTGTLVTFLAISVTRKVTNVRLLFPLSTRDSFPLRGHNAAPAEKRLGRALARLAARPGNPSGAGRLRAHARPPRAPGGE